MSPPEVSAALRYGSAEHYKARLAEVAEENDALRIELDKCQERERERESRRCAFLRGLNG